MDKVRLAVLLLIMQLITLCHCRTLVNTVSKEKCNDTPNSGHCFASMTRYYFEKGECKSFIYGGCGGNPVFGSLDECKLTCLSDKAL
ncbi:kunitz-type serine protease inhibitor 2-like [Lycorma delicatula]|uniref:kunitz-type serine protease inhibitor 2-like n=1 Tax=Lycorma delicatula TaxID=130591 RepID=UPI003F51A57E